MVGLKQVVTAIIALSLAECTVATPNTGIVEERGLETRKGGKVRGAIKANAGKSFDRVMSGVSAIGTVNDVVQQLNGQPPKKRGLQARADVKTPEAAKPPQPAQPTKSFSDKAFDRGAAGVGAVGTLTKLIKQWSGKARKRGLETRRDVRFRNAIKKNSGKAFRPTINDIGSPAVVKGSLQRSRGRPKQRSLEVRKGGKIRGAIKANAGKSFDRTTKGIETVGVINDIVQQFRGQPKQRSLEVRKGGRIRGAIKANAGKSFDRTTKGIETVGVINDIIQQFRGQPKQRSLDDDLEERAFEDYIMERYYS
ncbi:unnamed protein product [Clonostachys solani]|uniref:Uncharacterized protein n=1 Tax=Clonostachys solani TaxID=160281 RepID=A0A9N9ZAX7_9HYPO|nr:unnamed protein product [Clonostachys solani]